LKYTGVKKQIAEKPYPHAKNPNGMLNIHVLQLTLQAS